MMTIIMILFLIVLILFIMIGGLDIPQGRIVIVVIILFEVVAFLYLRLIRIKPAPVVQEKDLISDDMSLHDGMDTSSISKGTDVAHEIHVPPVTVHPASAGARSNENAQIISQNIQDWIHKTKAWYGKHSRRQQTIIMVSFITGMLLFLIILILWVSGSLFSGSPVGSWTQEGYETRIRYEIESDHTFRYYDNGVLSGTGTWRQSGKHVDFLYETYYGAPYSLTSYYVIRGDTMTSGMVVLIRLET